MYSESNKRVEESPVGHPRLETDASVGVAARNQFYSCGAEDAGEETVNHRGRARALINACIHACMGLIKPRLGRPYPTSCMMTFEFATTFVIWWGLVEGSMITNRLESRPTATPSLRAGARRLEHPSARLSRLLSQLRIRSALPCVTRGLRLTTRPGRAGLTPSTPIRRRRFLCLRLGMRTRVRVPQVQLWLDDIPYALLQDLKLGKPALRLGCQRVHPAKHLCNEGYQRPIDDLPPSAPSP
jgi:hypothetical protein